MLNEERWHASSWGRQYPPPNVLESHIFGGYYSTDTTEIANCDSSISRYTYNGTGGQCSIQFDNYVIITGGGYSVVSTSVFYTTVTAYNDEGGLIDLQPLVEG